MNTDSLVALALETCATNSPDVDAIFQKWNEHALRMLLQKI